MFRKRYSKGIAILLSAMVFFAAFGMLDVYPLSAEENSITNPANLSADHTNNTSDNAADTAGAADPSGAGGSMDAADLAGDASGADAAAMISGASDAEGSADADAAGLYADASDPVYDGTGADSGASYDLQKSTGARARRSYQSMMSEDAFSPEAVHEDVAAEQVDAVDPTETEIPVIADLPPPSDADPTGQNAQADAAAAEHAGGATDAENTAPAGEAGQDAAVPESGDANPVVTLTATDNKSYTITVSYNRLETRIPADAVLKAEPVEHKDPRFAPYAAQTANLLREKWAAQAGGQAADPAGTPSAGAAQATGQTTNPMNYNFTSPDDLRLFDIRLVSGTDGVTEYEPAEGTKVNVTIRLHNENEAVTKAAHPNTLATGVVHFNENSDVMTAAVTQVGADMEYKFDTDGFSLYGMATVDFTYDGFTYHIPVGSEILLSALFAELGISENAWEAQEVWFSNNELITVEQIEGDWKLTSTVPFQTEELLRIVMANGTVYEVQVTDATRITDASQITEGPYFIRNANSGPTGSTAADQWYSYNFTTSQSGGLYIYSLQYREYYKLTNNISYYSVSRVSSSSQATGWYFETVPNDQFNRIYIYTYSTPNDLTSTKIYLGNDFGRATSSSNPDDNYKHYIWTNPPTYSYNITYRGNNNTGGGMGGQNGTGDSVTLNQNQFTRNYYTFIGWNTNQNATTALYSDRETIQLTGDVRWDLYAIWERNYSITFNKGHNDATGNMPNQTGHGSPVTLNANQFTRNGYTFSGWATTSGGAKVYDNEGTVTFANSGNSQYTLTLYALWQQDVSNHTVTFNLNGHGASGTQPPAQTVAHNGTASVPFPEPSDTNYNFDGWYENDQGTGSAFDFSTQITADKVLYAKWTPKTYTITWKNDDDSLIDTTEVAYGSMPSHADPTKASTAEYSYTFAGWSPTLTAVTGPATYTATYTQTTRTYTITWLDGDGGTLKAEQVAYGSTPAYTGETPTKTATAQNTYTFNNTWSPAITPVTGDTTYTAQFNSTVRKYTITWRDGDDNTLATDQVAYGATPAYSGTTPTKTATTQYTYTFNGTWSPEITSVMGDATYTAQFTETLNTYTVTWNNYDGTTLETDSNVAYGTTPTYDGSTPTKPQDANYTYTFSGWTPTISSVTGDVTYTATYSSTARVYAITVDSSITNGSVASDKATAAVGETVTLTVTPASNYELDTLYYTVSGSSTQITISSNQFTMPAGDVTVTATFSFRTVKRYKLVSIPVDGKNYLIASGNSGSVKLLQNNNGTAATSSGTYTVDSNNEITLEDPNSVWTVSGSPGTGDFTMVNGTSAYLGRFSNTLGIGTSYSWTWKNNMPYDKTDSYLVYDSRSNVNAFGLEFNPYSPPSYRLYFYEEQDSAFPYTITFNANGGSGEMDPNPQTGTGTSFTLNANTFTHETLSFIGWNTKSDGSGTSYENQHAFTISESTTLTLYAQWGTPVYTITLDNQSATTPGTTAYYEKYGVGNYAEITAVTEVTSITVPSRTSYTFGGYFTGTNGSGTQYIDANGNITATSTTFSADTTLYAKWYANVTLTYDKGAAHYEGPMPPTYSGYGSVVLESGSFLNGFSEEGNFVCWNTISNSYLPTSATDHYPGEVFNLTENTTMYALFGHTITYDMGGHGINSIPPTQGVVYERKTVRPTDPVDPHYDFVNWYYDAGHTNAYDFGLEIFADTTIYALWEPKDHTITYNANGGSGTQMEDTTAEYNTPVTLRTNTYTNSGYVFTEWNTEPDGSGTIYADGATFNIPDDMTLYAQWKHSVTFDMNGAPGSPLPAVQYVDDGKYATRPDTDPSAAGYTFGGWYEEAACTNQFDFTTQITTNTIIYAKWSSNVRNLTIINNVTGAMGDSTKDFSYTVSGLTANTTYIAEANGTPTSITTDGTGAGTFILCGGQNYVIRIPTGATGVGVAQTDYSSEGYQTSYVLDSDPLASGTSVSSLSMSSDHTVTFTNTKAAVSPTAYRAERTAYVFILLLGGGVLAACLLLWRRGKRQKGGAPRQKN